MPSGPEPTWQPSTQVLQIVERFEEAWTIGKPRIEDHLPADEAERLEAIGALVVSARRIT